MIRIRVSEAELRTLIDERAPRRASRGSRTPLTWLERARQSLDHNRIHGRFDQEAPDWSEIKEVYLHVQHGKCAYCERKLADPQPDGTWKGKVEWDIEHFRPKNAIVGWPPDDIRATLGIPDDAPLTGAPAQGYYLLAHNPLNYLASCKTCNSESKRNYFPIAGAYEPASEDPRTLPERERPYLIYPLGADDAVDEDPEELITFDAVSPQPRSPSSETHRYQRAIITIQFFGLNEWATLVRERLRVLSNLGLALDAAHDPSKTEEDRRFAQANVERLTSEQSGHASCARAYRQLYDRDRGRARDIYRYCTVAATVDPGDSEERARMKLMTDWGGPFVDRLSAFFQRLKIRILPSLSGAG